MHKPNNNFQSNFWIITWYKCQLQQNAYKFHLIMNSQNRVSKSQDPQNQDYCPFLPWNNAPVYPLLPTHYPPMFPLPIPNDPYASPFNKNYCIHLSNNYYDSNFNIQYPPPPNIPSLQTLLKRGNPHNGKDHFPFLNKVVQIKKKEIKNNTEIIEISDDEKRNLKKIKAKQYRQAYKLMKKLKEKELESQKQQDQHSEIKNQNQTFKRITRVTGIIPKSKIVRSKLHEPIVPRSKQIHLSQKSQKYFKILTRVRESSKELMVGPQFQADLPQAIQSQRKICWLKDMRQNLNSRKQNSNQEQNGNQQINFEQKKPNIPQDSNEE